MNKPKLSKSGVSWTDYSWGVVDGCTKVSPACQNCYAEAMVTRFQPDRKFSDVICHSERLEAPLNTRKPGRVFVAPLGDLFHPDVPFEFIRRVYEYMAIAHWHTFQVLTKRPERAREFYLWWTENTNIYKPLIPIPNVWLGVTAENQEQADKRIPILLQIPAALRFISVGPMLGRIDLITNGYISSGSNNKIRWVACEGESGPHARPLHPADVRHLQRQCIAKGVAFYFKQWGEYLCANIEDDPGMLGGRAYNCPRGGRSAVVFRVGVGNNRHFRLMRPGERSKGSLRIMLDENTMAVRVGTKRAGCLLDGREWKQFPEVE